MKKSMRMIEWAAVKLPEGTLIRYWHSPRGNMALNLGGWRMGRLITTGRVWYVIDPLGAEETQRKFRIKFTKIMEVTHAGTK